MIEILVGDIHSFMPKGGDAMSTVIKPQPKQEQFL